MGLTLAIETSTLTGSVALLEKDRLVAERTLSIRIQHAERILPAIEGLLADAETRIQQIALIALSHGPGSFTGLRVGAAVAQGLSLAAGCPVVTVSTLCAMAMNAGPVTTVVVPVLDARRGEVYAGAYRFASGRMEPLVADSSVAIGKIGTHLEPLQGPLLIMGEGVEKIQESMNGLPQRCAIAPRALWSPRAAQVGVLAGLEMTRPEAGRMTLPVYLRQAL